MEKKNIATAFREILLNAIEHGGGSDPNKRVTITYVRGERALFYYVRDPGEGFSFDDIPHAAVSNPVIFVYVTASPGSDRASSVARRLRFDRAALVRIRRETRADLLVESGKHPASQLLRLIRSVLNRGQKRLRRAGHGRVAAD